MFRRYAVTNLRFVAAVASASVRRLGRSGAAAD